MKMKVEMKTEDAGALSCGLKPRAAALRFILARKTNDRESLTDGDRKQVTVPNGPEAWINA